MNIKVRLESETFGDFSPRVIIPESVLVEFENSYYADDNIIINYVLNKCKSFRKYGVHLNERFILWFE